MGDPLPSWQDGATRRAIIDFVETTARDVPPEERVAVFDNDGTLWVEKPLPIQADFILRRLYEMAEADPTLREKQPWKAAHERDYAWLGKVLDDHYNGDDTNVRVLLGAFLPRTQASAWTISKSRPDSFLHSASHPTLGRGYVDCGYAPMVELLATSRTTGSRTTSPLVGVVTSYGRSPRRCTGLLATG